MTVTAGEGLLRLAGAATAGVILTAVVGCGGGSSAGSADAGGSTAPTAAVAQPSSKAAPVKATGGGDFCKAIAASVSHPPTATGSAQSIAATVALVRKEERQAVNLAPDAIEPDVVLLLNASDKVWTALAKVNYDYSKITSSDMAALSSPDTVAAEKRLTEYMTNTCGLSIGAPKTP